MTRSRIYVADEYNCNPIVSQSLMGIFDICDPGGYYALHINYDAAAERKRGHIIGAIFRKRRRVSFYVCVCGGGGFISLHGRKVYINCRRFF